MNQKIEELRAMFDGIRQEADRLLEGLSDAQLQWRPDPKSWSIAENLAHLNSIDGQDLPNLFREIKRGRDNGIASDGPFQWSLFERLFIKAVSPPARLKVPAPKRYLPSATFNVRETILEFRRLQNDLHFLIGQADGLDLKKLKVPSPAAKWIKMALGARIELIAVHDRRHLVQAANVRKNQSFPKS